jgi:hypothetical protein
MECIELVREWDAERDPPPITEVDTEDTVPSAPPYRGAMICSLDTMKSTRNLVSVLVRIDMVFFLSDYYWDRYTD